MGRKEKENQNGEETEKEEGKEMSRLNYLLILNATSSKLTKAEETELQELVFSAKETETDCLICGETAIGDVRLCRGHAIYCWATKK